MVIHVCLLIQTGASPAGGASNVWTALLGGDINVRTSIKYAIDIIHHFFCAFVIFPNLNLI